MSLVARDAGGIVAWQCVGCGRIEAPRDCIGVCEYRKVTLAPPEAQATLQARLDESEARLAAMIAVLRKIAGTSPREGAFERAWAALQVEARRALGSSVPDPD